MLRRARYDFPSDVMGGDTGQNRELLMQNRVLLINHIRPQHFRVLNYKQVVSTDDWEEMTNKYNTTRERNHFLLETILRKGQRGIEAFFDVLGYEYPDLYEKIFKCKPPQPPDEYKKDLRDSWQLTRNSSDIIEKLRDVVDSFSKDLVDKKHQIQILHKKQENDRLHNERLRNELLNEMEVTRESEATLRREKAELESQSNKLKAQLMAAAETEDKLRAQIGEKEEKYLDLEKVHHDLLNDHRKAEDDCKLQRQKTLRAPTHAQLRALQDEILKLSIKLDERVVASDSSGMNEVIQLRQESSDAMRRLEASQMQNARLEIEMESLQASEEQKKAEVMRLCTEKGELITEMKDLRTHVSQLECKLRCDSAEKDQIEMELLHKMRQMKDKDEVIANYRELLKKQMEVCGCCRHTTLPRSQRPSMPSSSLSSEDNSVESSSDSELNSSHPPVSPMEETTVPGRLLRSYVSEPPDELHTSRARPSPMVDGIDGSQIFRGAQATLVYLSCPESHHSVIHTSLFEHDDFHCVELDQCIGHEKDILFQFSGADGCDLCLRASTVVTQRIEVTGFIVLSSHLPETCLEVLVNEKMRPLHISIEDESDCGGELLRDTDAPTGVMRTHLATNRIAHLVQDIRVELLHMANSLLNTAA